MAATRETVLMQKQVLELKKQGKSDRAIAIILGKNRRTVSRIIARGEAILPHVETPAWTKTIDWDKVRLEVSRGTQLNVLAREHAAGAISYVQF
jgi:transcriptional regulator